MRLLRLHGDPEGIEFAQQDGEPRSDNAALFRWQIERAGAEHADNTVEPFDIHLAPALQ